LLLLHDPLIALTGSAMVGHALLAISLAWFCLSLLRGAFARSLPWVGGLPTFSVVWALALLGTIYSLMDEGNVNVRAQFLATFVLMPVMWVAFSEQAAAPITRLRVHRLLLVYAATELMIMMLQIAYFMFGIGLPPGELYESMVSGSQFNGNNLAAIIVVLSIFYNATSQGVPRLERRLFNLITTVALLILFSRLAIILYIFDRLRSSSVKRMVWPLAIVVVLLVSGQMIEYTGNETIDTSIYKVKSLATIVEVSLEADSSTSSRSESYFNFVEQLGGLGVGSVAILGYSNFTYGATFADAALFINPHSMVIEFGYWMGWLGLLTLGGFILVAYMRPSQGGAGQRGFVLMAVIFASSIPSSAIPLPSFWAGLVMLAMLGAYDPFIGLRTKPTGTYAPPPITT
jgi:hypothetical protein